MLFMISRSAVHFAVILAALMLSEHFLGGLSHIARMSIVALVGLVTIPFIYRRWFDRDRGDLVVSSDDAE
ncbi:MAG: hypothetical protein CMN73_07905 [Sphingomonas sp.]|nr:hypothetical protein [Sphingomonas sp.]|tara:strand:- start:268 stop:477 length:210 start_codon:yes stop_codon:yes gene_type:complete